MENKTKKEMDEVITELKKFTSRVSTKHDPVDPALIGRFESRFGLKLPEDYKYLLGITNGFSVMGNEVLGMTDESYSYDLFKVYQFEHYEVIVPQYEYLIPFSPDGFGNFYCFDTLHQLGFGVEESLLLFVCSSSVLLPVVPPNHRSHHSIH